jgi:hypothetical protein
MVSYFLNFSEMGSYTWLKYNKHNIKLFYDREMSGVTHNDNNRKKESKEPKHGHVNYGNRSFK